MSYNRSQYLALKTIWERDTRRAQKLQRILLGAGETIENVAAEMPYFEAVQALKRELDEYERQIKPRRRLKRS